MPAKVPVSAKLLLTHQGRYLVLVDADTGLGDLPGGRLEPGEVAGDWEQALRREVAEELGPDVQFDLLDPRPSAFPHRIARTGEEAVGLLFLGRLTAGTPHLSPEHTAARWRPLADGADPGLQDTQRDAVAAALTAPRAPSRSAPSSSDPGAA